MPKGEALALFNECMAFKAATIQVLERAQELGDAVGLEKARVNYRKGVWLVKSAKENLAKNQD